MLVGYGLSSICTSFLAVVPHVSALGEKSLFPTQRLKQFAFYGEVAIAFPALEYLTSMAIRKVRGLKFVGDHLAS